MRRAAAFTVCLISLSGASKIWAQAGVSDQPVIVRVNDIRRLTPEQAARSYPVKIRGVITMDAPAPDFFVQDGTAGIYVEGSVSPKYRHVLGQFVEIEGVTGPGKFAPVIRESRLRVLGPGTLPKAQLIPFSRLSNGQQDSQWAQVKGIVRTAAVDRTSWKETSLAMRVASEGGEFNVRVPITEERDFSSWVDSEVLIEGVCGSLYNATRQLTGILFYVPRLSFIKVESAAPEVPVQELLRFTPGTGTRHRVRVRGIVGYQQLGKALFIQIQGKGLRVLTEQDTRVEIGDVVDVLGFPAMGESAPILEDAVFHRLAHQAAPDPVRLDLSVPWEQFDDAVVSTDAKLLERQSRAEGLELLLQSGDIIFDATLPSGSSANKVLDIPLNSRVRVKGICLVRSGGLWRVPESFRVLLRTPADVVVLSRPSWWNLRHTLWVLAATMSALFAVLGFVIHLGSRLREQMSVLRQKLRHSAILEERNRIARELHDTLEQELAGITMQLDLAADCFHGAPNVAKQALDTARSMSRHSMVEARRSVWDLRCHLLEGGDLVSALSQIVEPLIVNSGSKVSIHISGIPARLPGQIEMNLLRIGQEAVANALKHGLAQQVDIELHFGSDSVSLSVSDDGKGFAEIEGSPIGHFGLLDMQERAESMGSRLHIDSELGRGTRVYLKVSLVARGAEDARLKANTYSGS